MTRLETLKRIDNLTDNNCAVCPKRNVNSTRHCDACPIGQALQSLGETLSKERQAKIDELSKKERDLTVEDIKYLRANGLRQIDVAKILKVTESRFGDYELGRMSHNVLLNNRGRGRPRLDES